jgi:hypothetical protein
MLEGIKLRIKEINKLEKEITLITATHITIVTVKLFVTARAEHIPKI